MSLATMLEKNGNGKKKKKRKKADDFVMSDYEKNWRGWMKQVKGITDEREIFDWLHKQIMEPNVNNPFEKRLHDRIGKELGIL